MSAVTIRGVEGLTAAVGSELGPGEWIGIEQPRIDTFADATGDHQWIHVDAEQAAAGPYGATIAHGYLTLSLVPYLMRQLIDVHGAVAAINYGVDRIRFPAPVPVGSRVRLRSRLADVDAVSDSARVTFESTIELEGSVKPAVVVTHLSLYRFSAQA